jgi:predicted signal transduction protein with EAL and GGDEF domain
VTYALPEMETMLADADAALYASKRAGRGQASLHLGVAQKSLSA